METFSVKNRYTVDDLAALVKLLRDPEGGCPWDKVQTHESIRQNFIEETYEAADAIDKADSALLCEELGFTSAYNLDGGQSSVLLAKEGPINDPYRDGRPVSDIIAVCDLPQE